jgi:hypothetical protein
VNEFTVLEEAVKKLDLFQKVEQKRVELKQ